MKARTSGHNESELDMPERPKDRQEAREDAIDYRVSSEEFVRIWETSPTLDAVVDKLRALAIEKGAPPMPRRIVLARASAYRQAGVRIKTMRRGRKGLDITGLNRLIAKLNNRDPDTEPPPTPRRIRKPTPPKPEEPLPTPEEASSTQRARIFSALRKILDQ